ncbi:helix-turn-helix domain-containing protein [Pseudoalteromonas luteoviolacea]|uniref:helix-turn-helix domain-containing protein n=1 Tax=Pseudoalteromonas luteoviolacea TaxID=43657 RepID=UPI001B37C548|nr:helix-turn-helix domain-containing protein [Pseudoalteromonas luteoviolacea]MBQ4835832.1 helix-turn-helix domain-containing protein [Pseudoalteromonas luteoviolacea]
MWLELQQEFYLVSCLIALFCVGMMLRYEQSFDKGMYFLTSANLVLMLIPFTSYIQLKFNIHSVLISQIANNCMLLFCGLCFLFYRFDAKPKLATVLLHCVPFSIFLIVKVVGIHTQAQLMHTIYFGLMFSYVTAMWQSRSTKSATLLKQNKWLFTWVVFVVSLNGGVAVAYLSSSVWLYPLWLSLNITVCLYLLTFSFAAAYRIQQTQYIQVQEVESTKKQLQLSPSLVQSCRHDLKRLLEQEHIFLDNQLTLKQLAELLGLSQHQTSELLNEHMNKSFYALLNEYRISFACQLLKQTTSRDNITQIALDSGFNNKSSFYIEFKKQLGTTPTKWRAQYAL